MLRQYVAAQYGSFMTERETGAEPLYRAIVAIAQRHVRPGLSALDIGCATGRLVFEYALLGANPSKGVDTGKRFIDFCNSMREDVTLLPGFVRTTETTEFICGDILNADCGPFDFVSCINVIDRVRDPRALVAKIESLTLPGGIAVFSTPYDWDLSPAPKQSHTTNIKELLGSPWEVLEEAHNVPYSVAVGESERRDYACHVVVARKVS